MAIRWLCSLRRPIRAAKNSAPWIPAKGVASRPRLHDKPVKDGATIPIL